MTADEFKTELQQLLDRTLDEGPGPRAVALLVVDQLADHICNEAGAFAPQAAEEAIRYFQHLMEVAEDCDAA